LFGDAYLAGDERTFTAHLRQIMDDDAAREAWGRRAREMAMRFDVSRMGDQLVRVYEEVLARPEADRTRSARVMRPAIQWAFSARGGRR
jgi:hypothetical protein